MVAILVILMVASLVGMIICNKKQDIVPIAKPVAMLLMVVVLVCAVFLMKELNVFGGEQQAAITRENKYYVSQAFVAGEYIKNKLEAGKVLVLADSGYENDQRLPGFIEELKKGMGGGEVVIDTVTVPNFNPEMPEPLSEVMTAKDFDAAVAKNADAKVIVSLIGLPRDAGRLKALKDAIDKKGPAIVLIGYVSESGMGRAIASGAVSALITSSPTAVYDDKTPPRDMKEAFNIRYILVDKENLAQNANAVPN